MSEETMEERFDKKWSSFWTESGSLRIYPSRIKKFIRTELERQEEIHRAKMSAWYEVFGTTQLTHAQCRLETAERELERLKSELERQVDYGILDSFFIVWAGSEMVRKSYPKFTDYMKANEHRWLKTKPVPSVDDVYKALKSVRDDNRKRKPEYIFHSQFYPSSGVEIMNEQDGQLKSVAQAIHDKIKGK